MKFSNNELKSQYIQDICRQISKETIHPLIKTKGRLTLIYYRFHNTKIKQIYYFSVVKVDHFILLNKVPKNLIKKIIFEEWIYLANSKIVIDKLIKHFISKFVIKIIISWYSINGK